MIAIIGVAREQTGYFKSLAEISSQANYAGMDFFSGTLENTDVVIACSEMGKIPIAVAVQIAVDRFGAEMIIADGPASPLVPYLQQGDIVVADRLIQYCTDGGVAAEAKADNWNDSPIIPSDPGFTTRIADSYEIVFGGKSNRPQLVNGTIISSDRVIQERRTIGRLQRDYGAVAIDREGATLARVCRMNKISFLLLRTVVDTPDGEFYNYFDSQLQVVPEYITALVSSFIALPPAVPVA